MIMQNTIAAIATPQAAGGIAIIRLSGCDAIAIADRLFEPVAGSKPLAEKSGYTAAYGRIIHNDTILDTVVAIVYRAPRSYTGEDVVEICCHGGLVVTREVLRAVLSAGASPAQPGEFIRRAYENGKLTLTEAEAVIDIIQSHSRQALSAALSQHDGALYRAIQQIKETLLNTAGHLAAWADYPEDDIAEVDSAVIATVLTQAQTQLDTLLKGYDSGKLLRTGIDTAIVGKPNVGKSTLMNLLVGEQRSIVTEIAGTTRDIIEESVMVGDILLKLSDTAGIRDTTDTVEQFGVELAKKRLTRAALVLAVFDSSSPFDDEDKAMIAAIPSDCIVIAVVNKADLTQQLVLDDVENRFACIVNISAKEEQGVEQLHEAIASALKLDQIDTGAAMLANERQRGCAEGARIAVTEGLEALIGGMTLDAVSISIEQAIDCLMELTGERITVELANKVFSNFCVGK